MSDVDGKIGELTIFVQAAINRFDVDRKKIQFFQNEVNSLKEDLAKHQLALNLVKEENKKLLIEIAKLAFLSATIREEFARNLTSLQASLSELINDKVEPLPQILREIEAMKAHFQRYDHELEGVALDSRNSVLKTNNLEVITLLNRKKLENIQLNLKTKENLGMV